MRTGTSLAVGARPRPRPGREPAGPAWVWCPLACSRGRTWQSARRTAWSAAWPARAPRAGARTPSWAAWPAGPPRPRAQPQPCTALPHQVAARLWAPGGLQRAGSGSSGRHKVCLRLQGTCCPRQQTARAGLRGAAARETYLRCSCRWCCCCCCGCSCGSWGSTVAARWATLSARACLDALLCTHRAWLSMLRPCDFFAVPQAMGSAARWLRSASGVRRCSAASGGHLSVCGLAQHARRQVLLWLILPTPLLSLHSAVCLCLQPVGAHATA